MPLVSGCLLVLGPLDVLGPLGVFWLPRLYTLEELLKAMLEGTGVKLKYRER